MDKSDIAKMLKKAKKPRSFSRLRLSKVAMVKQLCHAGLLTTVIRPDGDLCYKTSLDGLRWLWDN